MKECPRNSVNFSSKILNEIVNKVHSSKKVQGLKDFRNFNSAKHFICLRQLDEGTFDVQKIMALLTNKIPQHFSSMHTVSST